jgi:ADP-ribose pyrophosphatase YjhB (NUDIX family)
MLTFQQGNMRFNYRIAGVAIHDGRVLVHRSEKDDFWALPGGRGEYMETAQDTLRREMQEEIGVDVQVERLLWVVENFFSFEGMQFHELGMYFLMTLPADCPYLTQDSFYGQESTAGPDGVQQYHLIFQWLALAGLDKAPLYPEFLRTGLLALPETTQHVVWTDT